MYVGHFSPPTPQTMIAAITYLLTHCSSCSLNPVWSEIVLLLYFIISVWNLTCMWKWRKLMEAVILCWLVLVNVHVYYRRHCFILRWLKRHPQKWWIKLAQSTVIILFPSSHCNVNSIIMGFKRGCLQLFQLVPVVCSQQQSQWREERETSLSLEVITLFGLLFVWFDLSLHLGESGWTQ